MSRLMQIAKIIYEPGSQRTKMDKYSREEPWNISKVECMATPAFHLY